MTPDDPRFRVCAPKNLPAHAWPAFPDFERYPDMRDAPPYWWHWFRVDRGRVVEMAGSGGDAELFDSIRSPRIVRVVAAGSPDAMNAAFRLLTLAQ